MSEISWIHSAAKLRLGVHRGNLQSSPEVVGGRFPHVKELNYFMRETDLPEIKGHTVDVRKWPPGEITVLLSEAYFYAVADTFQFMHKPSFIHSLTNFPHNKPTLSLSESRWLTAANLVWAIGTKWLQLAKLDRSTESHGTFYDRARALGLDRLESMEHPDMETVLAISLLAFYLFINGCIDR
jgi:hypothetical protein